MSRYYNPTRVDPSSDTCLRKRFHDRESRARFRCNSFIRHSRLPAQRLSRSRESGKTWGGNKRNKKVVKSERERDSADEVERGQRRSLLRGFARTPRRSPRVSKVPTTRVKWILNPLAATKTSKTMNVRAITRSGREHAPHVEHLPRTRTALRAERKLHPRPLTGLRRGSPLSRRRRRRCRRRRRHHRRRRRRPSATHNEKTSHSLARYAHQPSLTDPNFVVVVVIDGTRS